MTPYIPEEFSTRLIDWSPFAIMGNMMPPRDPDEDDEDEEDEDCADEPPVPNHYRRGFVVRQTGLAQRLQRVIGFRKIRFLAHGLLGTNRQCLKIHSA
jgi:hypothetical protein